MKTSAVDLIRKKQQLGEMSSDEIRDLVQGFLSGDITDYQLTAWIMAAYLNGLNRNETMALTREIKASGESLHWEDLKKTFPSRALADKHSTGGVGDKVSLILVPLAVHLDLIVPMMSGRGLGHTGGTVDKLYSIPGFEMDLSPEERQHALKTIHACMLSQTATLCPADKKLYALRDVTGCVDNIPLITASIVSKKWAEGVDNIVYDVKFGEGAFMSSFQDAQKLARSLVDTSRDVGLKARACITRMEEPLGVMIGNALEVEESLWILKNEYPSELHKKISRPLRNLCCALAANMATLSNTRKNYSEAYEECQKYLDSKLGYDYFLKLCELQRAEKEWWLKLPKANQVFEYKSPKAGFVNKVHSLKLGKLGVEIGIGRQKQEDRIDPRIGFEILSFVGQKVKEGDTLLKAHLAHVTQWKKVQQALSEIFSISDDKIEEPGELVCETLN
ncbi:MAG: thymidine phosphorylase [Proteobacteria bacterium]|nr:thymidine phosphorylase [Pseudomonadota bacterium]